MGDKEFKDFMENDPEGPEDIQSNSLPFYLVLCAREKSKTLSELYNASLDFYTKIIKEKGDKNLLIDNPLKDTWEYIKKIQEESLRTLYQYDVIMIDSDPYDEDEGPEDIPEDI